MGNEASRPSMDGSPQAAGGPAPPTPTPTPSSYGAQRRTQSFPTRSPSPLPSAAASTPRAAPPRVDKTIQRMDKAIRKRVRGGITYNMKLLIRGERGTGKTSLFHRLQGLPIPSAHAPTPQLQTATINWNLRVGTEESVKCEVWDVVDRGFVPSEDGDGGADGVSGAGNGTAGTSGVLHDDDDALASAAAAAAAAAMGGYTTAGASGMHVVAAVDASTVDVYHEAHGVIFLLDVTKWESLEYVRQQLENVPPHIPTLVLGNFRDCAAHQRKVFKEDIQDLLYGSSDRSLKQQQALRRPHELLYFECSLLNCYGLKALHQYFGIPFLQLKLATIRQQLRIVEGEFSHLKNDLQATIREQRYVDYLEHIKATGSDIRTGRRASNGQQHGSDVSSPSPTNESNGRPPRPETGNDVSKTTRRTSSIVSDTSDIVVSANGNDAGRGTTAAPARTTAPGTDAAVIEQDLGDLPERDSSSFVQVMPPLKIQHIEPATVAATTTPEDGVKRANGQSGDSSAAASAYTAQATASSTDMQSNGKEKSAKPSKTKKATTKKADSGKTQPARARKPSIDESMGLEDFQVPGQRNSDLDHFYSEDESEEEEKEDEDVVVMVADTGMKKIALGRSHKQVFIDSDSSDSEQEEQKSTRKGMPVKSKRRSPSSPKRRGPARGVEPDNSSGPIERVVESKQLPVSPPSPAISPPRPPQPSRNASASPRVRPRGSSPSRSPPSRTTQPDDSAPANEQEPVSDEQEITPSHVEEPLQISDAVEDIAASVSEVNTSHAATKSDNPAPVSPNAQSAPTSPRVPAEPRREDRQTSPNSSRCNSAVSVASADLVKVSETDMADMREPREVESVQSPQSVASGQDSGASGSHFKDSEIELAKTEEEPGRTVSEHGNDDSSSETSGLDAVSQNGGDAAGGMTVIDGAAVEHERTDLEIETTKHDAGPVEQKKSSVAAAAAAEDDGFAVDAASSSADMDAFLIDDAESSDEEANDSGVAEETVVSLSGSSLGEQKEAIDEENAKEPVGRAWEVKKQSEPPAPLESTRNRPLVLGSDEEDDVDDEREEAAETPLQQLGVMRSSRVVANSTALSAAASDLQQQPVAPKNDLEAFLNESESDSDGGAGPRWDTVAQTQPDRRASSDEDDDDDESARHRLSSYSASRKSRAQRRQEREELRQFSMALDASQRDLDAPAVSSASTSGAGQGAGADSIENSDVLAAIRRAQEEALRMISSVEGEPVGPVKAQHGEEKRREKKKDKPRKKSSRHAGDDDVEDRESKHRSSRRTSKKSSSSSRSRRQHVANSESD